MEREVMNRTESREMEEILKLLELENIHLSDENIRATYVGSGSRVPVTAFRLLAGLKPLNRCLSILDLSFCRLDNLVAADRSMKDFMKTFENLSNLNSLIADNCGIDDDHELPLLLNLRTLSLNKNKLTNLSRFIDRLRATYGVNLHHLSLLGNPLCPYPINSQPSLSNDLHDGNYSTYKSKLVCALPSLKFLDNSKISSNERSMTSQTSSIRQVNDQRETFNLKRSKRNGNIENSSLRNHNNASEKNNRFYKRSPGAIYGKLKYKYLGKNSEGNRFIKNVDL